MSGKELEVYNGGELARFPGDKENISLEKCRINAVVTQGGNLTQNVYQNQEPEMGTEEFLNLSSRTYNLFVLDDERYKKNIFILPREACLCDGGTSEANRQMFQVIDEKLNKEICNMPCIIASSNPDSLAVKLGMIENLDFLDIGIEFKFRKYRGLLKDVLQKDMNTLGICHTRMYSEFDNVHWSMKEIDLLRYLRKNNLLKGDMQL